MTKPTKNEILETAVEIMESGEHNGVCLECGEIAYYVEPDATKYPCESCGMLKVYGAGMIIIMNGFYGRFNRE